MDKKKSISYWKKNNTILFPYRFEYVFIAYLVHNNVLILYIYHFSILRFHVVNLIILFIAPYPHKWLQ
jgi:hypothetical protein